MPGTVGGSVAPTTTSYYRRNRRTVGSKAGLPRRPETEGRCDVQTEEMPTVRPKRSPRPAARFEHFDNLEVAGKPIAVDRIEQQDIAVAPQAGIPVEELGLRRGEQSFSRCNRTSVARGDGAEGFEIEWVTNVLKPPEPQGRERVGRLDAAGRRIGIYRVDGEVTGVGQYPCGGLNPL